MRTGGIDRKGLGVKGLVVVIVSCVTCSAATVAAYDIFFAQKIVAVDLASSIASQKEEYTAGKITADQLVENIEALLKRMEKRKRNEVLILEEAVAGDTRHRSLGNDGGGEEE